jgi:hypothetical protein
MSEKLTMRPHSDGIAPIPGLIRSLSDTTSGLLKDEARVRRRHADVAFGGKLGIGDRPPAVAAYVNIGVRQDLPSTGRIPARVERTGDVRHQR